MKEMIAGEYLALPKNDNRGQLNYWVAWNMGLLRREDIQVQNYERSFS